MTKGAGAAGHNMGRAAQIRVHKEYKGSGLADPLPKHTGKFAHVDGQLDLLAMGAIEMPDNDGGDGEESA